jgi:predicted nuclease of predicted toxin-antitoxin system
LKVLFDEDMPGKLARTLRPRHEIHTVATMQWGGIKNGELLTLIEHEHFDVFLTGDKNIRNQQRLEGRPFAVLIMSANNWPVIRPHVDKISIAIDDALPGTVNAIDPIDFLTPHQSRRSPATVSSRDQGGVRRRTRR